jgi:D-sedoheptulose 7-phosphate isomerase
VSYVDKYLEEVKSISELIDRVAIEKLVDILVDIREQKGRIFFLGVGGGAGNAGHAVNDFRKIAGIESYAPTDNVSELTARINDDGWENSYVEWLKGCNPKQKDGVFVFSVGGGSREQKISVNLVKVIEYAKKVQTRVLGIVGRDGGYTGKVADGCVIIPVVNASTVTPHTEAFQSVIWHLIVTHPKVRLAEMKWESIK